MLRPFHFSFRKGSAAALLGHVTDPRPKMSDIEALPSVALKLERM